MSALTAWRAAPDSRPILSMRSVRKCFARGLARAAPRTVAIDDVDLDVAQSEIVAVFGSEGAGKTTLLQCACGLLRPDRGVISWHGTPVIEGLSLTGISYAPAVPLYYPFVTPRDVLAFRLAKNSPGTFAHALVIDDIASLTDLESVIDRSISRLSRGEVRNVAIAEALASSPELLVIDTGVGECVSEKVLSRIAARGTAIVVALRDCASVASVATRLIHLEQGKIDRSFSSESQMMFVAERFH